MKAGSPKDVPAYSSIINCTSHANLNSNSTKGYTGGIIGFSSDYSGESNNKWICDILKCSNDGNIKSNQNDTTYVGGIAGSCTGIKKSQNAGNIEVSNTSNYTYVGGIEGNGRNAEICSNEGDIIVNVSGGNLYVGGIAGNMLTGPIKNCYNQGDITSQSTSYSYVGGLIGSTWNITIDNSYNSGNIFRRQ